MNRSRAGRIGRGALAASFATFVALLSHVAASGHAPGWVGIAVPLVLSFAVCTLLAGRRLSLVRLAVAIAVSQFLFHVLFALGTVAPSSGASPRAVHDHTLPMLAGTGDGIGAAVHAGPEMWLGHALAAAVTVVVLHRAESDARRLQALARDVLVRVRRRLDVVALPAPTGERSVVVAAVALLAPTPPPLPVRARRGPPAAHAI